MWHGERGHDVGNPYTIPRFRRLCGHDMEDQFGQELGRGTHSSLLVLMEECNCYILCL